MPIIHIWLSLYYTSGYPAVSAGSRLLLPIISNYGGKLIIMSVLSVCLSVLWATLPENKNVHSFINDLKYEMLFPTVGLLE